MPLSCTAVDCRFCKYERECDGIPTRPSASPLSSMLDEIRSRGSVAISTIIPNSPQQYRDGTTSSHSLPDDTCFDMDALASSLRSRTDSVHSCGDGEEDVELYYTQQSALPGDGIIPDETCGDVEMEDDAIDLPSPTPSSVYSNDDPLLHPFFSSLHSPLYTQSESGIPDDIINNNENGSLNFLDEVLFDLDAWLDAGGLEMGGLHDDMGEEEYAEYKAWYKAIVGGVARGMVERGVVERGWEERGVERRRSV